MFSPSLPLTLTPQPPRTPTLPPAPALARMSCHITSHDDPRHDGAHLIELAEKLRSAIATSRHAPVSLADPSAVRYRVVLVPPLEPLPSAMLSDTLAAARRS